MYRRRFVDRDQNEPGNGRAKLDNQHHLEIHDIVKSWAGYKKIVSGFKKVVGIVSIQECRSVETLGSASLNGRTVNDSSGRVGRSIDAVGARAENHDTVEPVYFDRCG